MYTFMVLKDKINTIIVEQKISGVQFAEKIGIQKSAVYNILKGKTKKLNPETAKKIITVFSEYSYSWLMQDEGVKVNALPKRGSLDAVEVAETVINNFDELMKNKLFNSFIENIKLAARNEALTNLFLKMEEKKNNS